MGSGWGMSGTPGGMGSGIMSGPGGMSGMGMTGMQATAATPLPPDWEDFSTTGDSLFALLFGALGGVLAARFSRSRTAVCESQT